MMRNYHYLSFVLLSFSLAILTKVVVPTSAAKFEFERASTTRGSRLAQILQTPTPGQNHARIRHGSPPALLRGMSFTSGGAAFMIFGACEESTGELAGRYNLTDFQPNQAISLSPSYGDIRQSWFPAICTTISQFSAYAISPTGDVFTPLIWKSSDTAEWYLKSFVGSAIQLPINAYFQPGLWKLEVNTGVSYEFLIDISAPDSPFLIWDGAEALLGGFQPSEEVVGLFYDRDGFVGDVQTTASTEGYALFTLEEEDRNNIWSSLFVGKSGRAVAVDWFNAVGGYDFFWDENDPRGKDGAPGFPWGEELSAYEAITRIHQTYWNDTHILMPDECPGFPASQMYLGAFGYVSTPRPSDLHFEPESTSIVGQMPPGSWFHVVGGPICSATGNEFWWQVQYEGLLGWASEGKNSSRYLSSDSSMGIYLVATVMSQPGDPLNVRAGPGSDYPVVDKLTAGTLLPLYARNKASTWLLVSPYDQQWVSAEYITTNENISILPVIYLFGTVEVQENDPLNVRTGPGINYPVVKTLGLGTAVWLYGRNQSATWVLISPYEKHWVNAAYLNISGNLTNLPVKS
jgi:uncharacterized protein YraI